MFYIIYVRPIVSGIPRDRHVLGYYLSLGNAKNALMDWVRDILKKDPDKKYRELPADRRRERAVFAVSAVAPGSSTGMEGVIVEAAFDDTVEGITYHQQFYNFVNECKTAVVKSLSSRRSVDVPYDEEDEHGDNATVMVQGRHGYFNLTLKKIALDDKDRVLLGGVDEDGYEYEPLDWYVQPSDWSFLADVVCELAEEQETEQTPKA